MPNYHFDFPGVQGKFTRNVKVPNVNRHSCIAASAVEIKQPQGEPLDFPFIGAATDIAVKNVCPQDDGSVSLIVDTNWNGSNINVRVTLLVNPA